MIICVSARRGAALPMRSLRMGIFFVQKLMQDFSYRGQSELLVLTSQHGMRRNRAASAHIDRLATAQAEARNYISTLLNRRLPVSKLTSARKGARGVSSFLADWKAAQPDRTFAASSILVRGGVLALLSNSQMQAARAERISRLNACIDEGRIPPARLLWDKRRTLAPLDLGLHHTLDLDDSGVSLFHGKAKSIETRSGNFSVLDERTIRIGAATDACVITLTSPLPCAPAAVRSLKLVPMERERGEHAPRYSVRVSYTHSAVLGIRTARKSGRRYISDDDYALTLTRADILGMDDGVKRNWTFDTGAHFTYRTDAQERAARAQAGARRKKRGSKRQAKARRQAREYSRIAQAERRRQFNAFAIDVLDSEKPAVVAVEDKSTRSMMRSAGGSTFNPGRHVAQKSGLNRSLASAALAEAQGILEVQALKRGRPVVKVFAPTTSMTCGACGEVSGKSRRSQACFVCVSCGHTLNADTNAAQIIGNRAYYGIRENLAERHGVSLPLKEQCPTGWQKQPSGEGQRRFAALDKAGSPRADARRGQRPGSGKAREGAAAAAPMAAKGRDSAPTQGALF